MAESTWKEYDGADDSQHYYSLKQFLRKWGIDGPTTVDLMLCNRATQKLVMDTFRFISHGSDINLDFAKFVKTLSKEQRARSDFLNKFGLNESSENELRNLPWELQEDIMSNFRPKPHSTDLDRLFKGFITTRQLPDKLDTISKFIKKFGLDEHAENQLRDLPEMLQEDIMSNFSPDPHAKDVNRLFQKCVSTRKPPEPPQPKQPPGKPPLLRPKDMKREQQEPEERQPLLRPKDLKGQWTKNDNIRWFVDKFALDEESERQLRKMPEDRQADVMDNFSPKPHVKDVNTLFQSFIATRVTREEWNAQNRGDWNAQPATPPNDDIEGFVAKFGLDEGCEERLRNLPAELQEDVMANFSPKYPDVRNISALFSKFVTSREQRTKQDKEDVWPVDDVSEFIHGFGLDESCEEYLRSLDWNLQEDIMANFDPKPGVENMYGLFMKFASTRTVRAPRPHKETFEGQYSGTIKSFVESKGYGFIECQEIKDAGYNDVFLHHAQLLDFKVGDRVMFTCVENSKGQPQVSELFSPDEHRGSSGPDVQSVLGTYTGSIKNFNEKNGYGFITCQEIIDQGYKDVFLHHSQIGDFKIGEEVQFTAFINKKGNVQAMELETAGEPPAKRSKHWV